MSILTERVLKAGGTVASAGKLGSQDLALIKSRVKDAVYADAQKLALRTDPRVRRQLERTIRDRVMEEGKDLPRILRPALEKLADEIVNEVFGYGPIQPLLDDPEVTEVMVNGPGRPVWYEKDGVLYRSDVVFSSP
ncbi:MAG: CpaF family protein, partial [Firmicutes bacterium]|nr:CpaF family protein [Bacillota bacterium]